MHFWIDKRSQVWAGRKMATPVHRFQAIEGARRPRPPLATPARCSHSRYTPFPTSHLSYSTEVFVVAAWASIRSSQ